MKINYKFYTPSYTVSESDVALNVEDKEQLVLQLFDRDGKKVVADILNRKKVKPKEDARGLYFHPELKIIGLVRVPEGGTLENYKKYIHLFYVKNTNTSISSIFIIPETYNYAIEQNNNAKYEEYKQLHLNNKIYVNYGKDKTYLPIENTSKILQEANISLLGNQVLKIRYTFSDTSIKDITINFNVVKPPKILPIGKTITVAKDTKINPKMFISNLGKVEQDIEYSFIGDVSTKSDGQFSVKIKALFSDGFESTISATLIVKTYYDDFIITDSPYGKNTHYTLNIDKYYNQTANLPDIKKEAKILEIHNGIKSCEKFKMPNYENVEEFKYNLDLDNYKLFFYQTDFSNFKNIKEFKFPNNCKNLYGFFINSNFSNWSSIEKFAIPNNLNAGALFNVANFSNWTTVKEFIIPENCNLPNAFQKANFSNWTSVKGFVLPLNINNSSNMFVSANFSNWTSVKEFVIPKYTNSGVFEETNFSGWISLEYLEIGCIHPTTNFKGCNNLLHLKIDIETGLGDEQFNNLPKLNNLELINVSHIGNKTFSNNPSLTSLSIPDSTADIDYGAFMDCNGITTVTIGTGIKSINSNCFKGCTSLTDFTIKATTPPTLYGDIFDPISIPRIKVPNASVDSYKNNQSWKQYSSKIIGV